MPNIIPKQFISEKTGAKPRLPFYNLNSPCLNIGEEVALAGVAQNSSNVIKEGCVIIDRQSKYAGICTAGMSYCHALAMIQRDENGIVTKLAMHHFSGGLTPGQIGDFINHCTRNNQFSGNLELVHYPGDSEGGGLDEDVTNSLKNRTFAHEDKIMRIYHAAPCSSCCVMFNGQIGSADFAPVRFKNAEVEFNASILEKKAEAFFDTLITSEPDQKKKNKLERLKQLILNDKLLIKPKELLEQTRQLILNSEQYPDKKQAYFEAYTQKIEEQPKLSTKTKIGCLLLAATIIGIVPAVLTAGLFGLSVRNARRQLLDELKSCSDAVPPISDPH